MRRLTWSDHALRQIEERKIAKRTVAAAFKNPDRIVHQAGSRYRLLKIIRRLGKDYLLIVVFDREDNADIVVTIFITSKIKKYLL